MRTVFKKKRGGQEIDPDEIFLDARNLPRFDQSQFEGRLEKPLSKKTFVWCGIVFFLLIIIYTSKTGFLQLRDGRVYAEQSNRNSLRHTVIFPERGLIYDRNGVLLATNVHDEEGKGVNETRRNYRTTEGLGHVLGYLRYPAKDAQGFYYRDKYEGMDGVEKMYDERLSGSMGKKIVETDAHGHIEAESILERPKDGESLTLSVDSRVQEKFYALMKETADRIGFAGGAGIIVDVATGELLALVNYPEYDPNVLSNRTDPARVRALVQNPNKPFLNRAVDGLYTPGSVVKPFIALAALAEGVIAPEKEILSTGSISLPNPYDASKKTVFKDWRAHGYTDMRRALAVSSDVYFYQVGGGFENQTGLGIERIEKYMRMFGFGVTKPNNSLLQKGGVIPSPAWKAEAFGGDPWRIGDTYNTSIGQYGFQVTLLQIARAMASLANGGILPDPTLLRVGESSAPAEEVPLAFSEEDMQVVREGMREAVTAGTAKALAIGSIDLAAKTGTAELGTSKKFVNSWITGFFPYEHPRYAFATIMEKGPYANTVGALYVMRGLFEWMTVHTPEYLKAQS